MKFHLDRFPILLLILLGLLTFGRSAAVGQSQGRVPDRCIGSACFPELITDRGVELPLRDGRLSRFWGFRVYTAALYVKRDVQGTQGVMSDVPKRLVLHYHRSISASDLIKSTDYYVKFNPNNDAEALKERLERLYAAYKGVSNRDEYTITYVPEKGTLIALNGVEQLTIEGEDFARAFFGIWLSEYSLNSGIQKQLVYGS